MARAGLGPDWKCLFANDISSKKGDAYKANWGDDDFHLGDVFKLRVDDLPGEADLMWGSFPCQDLSLAGNGLGLNGERSGAFWGFWALVRKLAKQGRKPKMLVLENVYGTLTSHEGKDFKQIANAVAQEGYVFGAMVVDAVHFVPQSRPRLFVIGIDSSLDLPENIYSEIPAPAWHPAAIIRAYNDLQPSVKALWRWWNPAPPACRVSSLDEIVEANPKGVDWHTPEETQKLLRMMSPLNRRKVIEAQRTGALKVGTVYKRTRDGVQRAEIRFDGVAGCLRTPSGGSSRQTILIVDGERIRSRLISPREAARLMGLRDTYVLPARYNEAYHLLGDGVVVPVVSHLRKFILSRVMDLAKRRYVSKTRSVTYK